MLLLRVIQCGCSRSVCARVLVGKSRLTSLKNPFIDLCFMLREDVISKKSFQKHMHCYRDSKTPERTSKQ